MKKVKLAIFLAIHILVISCAKQTSPTGGPKDTIPPTLTSSQPRKGQTNIKPKQITLEFDEAITLNNPKDQILVTPDIQKKYKIEGRNRSVNIQLETELLDSTTYLISFREAIQDLTEKNPARDLKLAFSTGIYIDSLKISGTIRDQFKNIEIKDATVALYESDTFNIFKHKPTYITKTNQKGEFLFEYLKHGTYHIYAFDDKNKNLITDSKSESFGFLTDSLVISTNRSALTINISRLDSRPFKLTSSRPYNTYSTINFVKGIEDYQLTTSEADTIYSTYGDTRATIQVYNTFAAADSTQVKLIARDSADQKIDTTLYIKFSQRPTQPEKFSVTLSETKLTTARGILTGRGTFTKPISAINTDSIFIKLDSVTSIPISKDNISIDNKLKTFTLEAKFDKTLLPKTDDSQQTKPKNKPLTQLYLGQGTFISVEKDSSTVIKQTLTPLKEDDLSVLKLQIETNQPNYILDLLTKDYKIVTTRINPRTLTLDDLLPGDYIIRITIDSDGNGRWSPGNFATHREPEKFVYYLNEKKTPTVSLKANWELGPLLIKF